MKNIRRTQILEAHSQGFQVEVSTQAPVLCKESISITAPAHIVWELLTNINRWPEWNPEIQGVKSDGQRLPGSKFNWKSGGSSIRSSIHTVEPVSSFGWSGQALGIRAIHNWSLIERSGVTIVVSEESMDGLLAGLLKGLLRKKTSESLQLWLSNLKSEAETTMALSTSI